MGPQAACRLIKQMHWPLHRDYAGSWCVEQGIEALQSDSPATAVCGFAGGRLSCLEGIIERGMLPEAGRGARTVGCWGAHRRPPKGCQAQVRVPGLIGLLPAILFYAGYLFMRCEQ